jgi:hypothetical protein
LILVFALPFVAGTVLERWYPSTPDVRLVGGIRTLAVASVVVATLAPLVTGSGGAGVLIYEGYQSLDYVQILRGLTLVVLLSLIVDLLLGALQYLFSQPRSNPNRGKARALNHATPMSLNPRSEAAGGSDSRNPQFVPPFLCDPELV